MIHLVLSEELKRQFNHQFLQPVTTLFANGQVKNPTMFPPYSAEAIAIKNEQRNTFISFGRGQFSAISNRLTATQRVDLYCYYYFQMHFTSSYVFYLQEQQLLQETIKNKTVWFIDMGCGPFTSGLAFNRWLTNCSEVTAANVNYIGVDTSKEMLEKASIVAKHTPDLQYKSTLFINDKKKLFDVPFFENAVGQESVVILNFSYLFGSDSLTVADIVSFTNNLIDLFLKLNHQQTTKFLILQQNPDYESSNKKWWAYKSQLKNLSALTGYPKIIEFGFDDLFGSFSLLSCNFNVRCDVLKSF